MKVAVLLSGGVDSSVSLRLLQDAGHDVAAFYLKIWLEDEMAGLGECPWDEDLRYARAVCEQAGVPLEVLSLQREYHQQVVAEAIAELADGRTPSPDIWCNQRIKFGAFLDHLDDPALEATRSFDRVASGHYARIDRDGDGDAYRLLRGVDAKKDQTYFLYRLSQAQLARCLFPLGAYTKAEVRQLAQGYDLPNRDRPDSQGVCFLGKIRFDDFVRAYLGDRPGEIRDQATGEVLGQHAGPWFFTIGQRKGLGLAGGPWYVVAKDLDANVVWVSHSDHAADQRRQRFTTTDAHWIGDPPSDLDDEAGVALGVKLRHGPTVHACRVHRLSGAEGSAGGDQHLTVALDGDGDAGVAAGQSAVLYDGEVCLGGGVIAEPLPNEPVTSGRASSR